MHELKVTTPLPGYAPAVGAALWRMQDARDRTLQLLADLPAGFVDRAVHGNTIGTVLYHLALIETDWLCAEILEEPYPADLAALLPVDARDRAGVLTAVGGRTLDRHLARLETVRAIFLARLRPMTDEDLHRPRSLPRYDVSPAWVMHHLTQHEAEHRGEMGSVIAFLREEAG